MRRIKFLTIFITCLLLRLMPFRAPNLEPIMASIMPLGRQFGPMAGFSFGLVSMIIYDSLTNFGAWTWTTGLAYGLIGLASFYYFKKFKTSVFHFALFAFLATIFFDLVTGVLFAPMFEQTILNALVLQIPFTILHLAGNIGLAVTISPILNKWLISEKFFAWQKQKNSLLAEVKI